MKTTDIAVGGSLMLAGLLAASTAGCGTATGHGAPKKVLVVTVTKGFRHSSIPTAEKVLGELAKKDGSFQVDYASVEPSDPKFKGPDGKTDTNKVDRAIREVLAKKMSLAALAKLD